MVVATEHHTTAAPLDVQWVSLAEVLRHVITLKRAPEADIRSEIIEAIASGKLPHFVERTTEYLPRQFTTYAAGPYPTDAPKEKLREIKVTHNEPMPPEVLERGKVGRGSLYIDWQKSGANRRAGLTWSRIEFEGIRCSREHMLVLWPLTSLTREPVFPVDAQDMTPVTAPATSDLPLQPKKKRDRLHSVMIGLRQQGKLRPKMQPREVRKLVLPEYRKRWRVEKEPSPRTVQRVYETLCQKPASSK
jgi:hypothetical protein